MMKQFYQLVNKLFERTFLKTESLRLQSGDHQIPTSTSQNTSHISSKSLEKIVSYYNIGKIEKIGEAYGTSVLIINGAPWACDNALADQLEDYLNGKKRHKEGIEKSD